MSVDFFLKVDGANGESTAQGHTNEIKIHSWSWGAAQVTSVSGSGGSGAGKASLSEINIMKDYDQASPELFKMLLTGKHIDALREPGGSLVKPAKIDLHGFISRIHRTQHGLPSVITKIHVE